MSSRPSLLEHLESENTITGLYAGFWIRFWAYLFDLVVIASFQRIIVYPFIKALDIDSGNFLFTFESFFMTAVFFAYFILMTKYFNQTLGKMVFGIKVTASEKELTWGTVIFRELVGRFISKALFGLVYVWVAFSPTKQGVHDFFADTWVLHTKK